MKKNNILFYSLFLIVIFIFGIGFIGTKFLSAQTTTTSKSVETIILPDTDGDGILDRDDPHPKIAEIYIVEDNNKNGIVDKFEKSNGK